MSTEVRIDKQNVLYTYATIWKNLEDSMLSETNQSQKRQILYDSIREQSKSETESGMMVARNLGEVGMGNDCLMGIELRFYDRERIMEMDGGDCCTL